MQGEEFCPLCSACFNIILTHAYTSLLFEGIPANPKTDHHWVKRKSTKDVFCQNIFNFMPCFFLHHQIDLAQQDGKNILLYMINAVSHILCLDFDFPENYTHINQVFNTHLQFHVFYYSSKSTNSHLHFFLCTIQLMSQMRWFKKLSTVILIILAHYYDFALGRRACCTHFCITDDLEKSNEMITHCVDHVREYYDRKNTAAVPVHPPNARLFLGSDNAGNQAKNNYHFAWMIDYVEEDHGLQTIQQNFTAEQHGKRYLFSSNL